MEVGDIVRIRQESLYYLAHIICNPKNTDGIIIEIRNNNVLNYHVNWSSSNESNNINCYDEKDLELISLPFKKDYSYLINIFKQL